MPWSAVTYSAERGGSCSARRWASRSTYISWPRQASESTPKRWPLPSSSRSTCRPASGRRRPVARPRGPCAPRRTSRPWNVPPLSAILVSGVCSKVGRRRPGRCARPPRRRAGRRWGTAARRAGRSTAASAAGSSARRWPGCARCSRAGRARRAAGPVPTEAREVAVVAGKPAVIGRPVPPRELASSEVQERAPRPGGPCSCSQPRPSIRKTQFRSAGVSSGIAGGHARDAHARRRAWAAGRRASRVPYSRDGRGVERRAAPGRCQAGVGPCGRSAARSRWPRSPRRAPGRRRASGARCPGRRPASLTRRLRSSAVELPV